MKLFPAFAAATWVCAVSIDVSAQAAPPQPVIQLSPRAATAAANPGRAAAENLDPDLGRKLSVQGACLGDGTGYLRARIRGALDMDVNWKDGQLSCGGEARPNGSGLRMSFAGRGPDGKIMRVIFGVSAAREGRSGRELPTNLTLLLDGGRIFATRGDDKCTLDTLEQHELPPSGSRRPWRIEARGFCVAPANAVTGTGRILISRFDFAGRAEFSGRK
jgi:hypothetical protein